MDEATTPEQTVMEDVGRLAARGFVIGGGVFWALTAFSGPYVFHGVDMAESLRTALWPFLAAVVILFVGWTYERLAAVLLFGASVAVLVWGSLFAWEIGVWILMSFVLIAPMMLAGILFLLAAHAEAARRQPSEPQHPVPVKERLLSPAGTGMRPNANTQ